MLPYLTRQIQCSMSCHELYGYTCQYKFSGTGYKEFYHSFYCYRESSFLIHTNAALPLLLTKALAMLQSECYYKIFYYSIVNIWLSFPLCSQLCEEDFTLIVLIYCQVRKTDFQILTYSENEWCFSWKSCHTLNGIVKSQTLFWFLFVSILALECKGSLERHQ
jgi:hypothetical protein